MLVFTSTSRLLVQTAHQAGAILKFLFSTVQCMVELLDFDSSARNYFTKRYSCTLSVPRRTRVCQLIKCNNKIYLNAYHSLITTTTTLII